MTIGGGGGVGGTGTYTTYIYIYYIMAQSINPTVSVTFDHSNDDFRICSWICEQKPPKKNHPDDGDPEK